MWKKLAFAMAALGMSVSLTVVTLLYAQLSTDYKNHLREHKDQPGTNHVLPEGNRTLSCVATVIFNSSAAIFQPSSTSPPSSPTTTPAGPTKRRLSTLKTSIIENDILSPTNIGHAQTDENPESILLIKNSRGNGTIEFGESCNITARCKEGFICNFDSNITCTCPHRDQVYIPKLRKCGSKVGGPCGDSIPCANYSFCQRFPSSSNGLCACPPGVPILKEDRVCNVNVGKDCSSSSECKPESGIACINGLCQCEGFSKYIQEGRKCVRLVGSGCDTRSPNDRPRTSECAENSACKRITPFRQGIHEGICSCAEGFQASPDYLCIRSSNT